MHSFLEDWFRGEIAPSLAVFARIESVWKHPFEIIGPDGTLRTSSEVLAATFAEHGSYPDLTIRIKNLRVYEIAMGAAAIARYEEWHTDEHGIDPRLCSATLVRPDVTNDKMTWVQIHESVLANHQEQAPSSHD